MVLKLKESFEKNRHVKNNDKSKKYVLRGQRNVRHHETKLLNKNKPYEFNFNSNSTYLFIFTTSSVQKDTRHQSRGSHNLRPILRLIFKTKWTQTQKIANP